MYLFSLPLYGVVAYNTTHKAVENEVFTFKSGIFLL